MFVPKANKFNLYIFNIEFPHLLPKRLLRYANNTNHFQFGIEKSFELVDRCLNEGIVLRINKPVKRKKGIITNEL